jgi:REP element-mobilizing transposase RayT
MAIPLKPLYARVRHGAYLPHWTLAAAVYHVVFRLSDSLPATVVARFRAEREALSTAAQRNGLSPDTLAASIRKAFSHRIDSCLDHGLGACWLAREGVAALTTETLQYFDDSRYSLHAWCVMPNHVHVVVQPLDDHELPKIVKSWRSYIAREANRMLFRSGEFWQPEYYDHLIRNDADLAQTMRYVQENPMKAGLRKWNWVWPVG